MGFVVLLVAVPRGRVEPRLAVGEPVGRDAPGIAGELAGRITDPAAAAAAVASAVRKGGEHLDADATTHLAAVVLSLGDVLADLPSEAGDDTELASELLGGMPALAVGAAHVGQLLAGPVAGCTSDGRPSLGRWQAQDMADAAEAMAAVADELDEAAAEQLLVLYACVDRAAEHDRDLYAVCL